MLKNRLSVLALIALLAALGAVCFADNAAQYVLPHSLVKRIPTEGPGVPVVVFNPLSWERTDAVEVESPFPGESPHVKITDSAGKVYPARTLGDRLRFTARGVPALGYRVYWAERVAKPLPTAVRCTTDSIENQYFRVNVDKSRAVITGIYDKINSRQLIPAGSLAARLQLVQGAKIRNIDGDSTTTMMDSGPARGVLILDNSLGECPLVKEVILHDGVPRLDIRFTSEWAAPANSGPANTAIRVSFPTTLTASKPEKGGLEIFDGEVKLPGVRWADITSGSYGISILGDNVHSCEAAKGLLTVTLRKPGDPSGGLWESRYSVYTHKGNRRTSGVFERSMEIANPLIARLTTKHPGDLPRTCSIMTYTRPGLAAVLIPTNPPLLQFHNTTGSDTLVQVKINTPGIKLTPADPSGTPHAGARSIIERTFTFLPTTKSPVTYVFSWEE